jgi:hypothetical protein
MQSIRIMKSTWSLGSRFVPRVSAGALSPMRAAGALRAYGSGSGAGTPDNLPVAPNGGGDSMNGTHGTGGSNGSNSSNGTNSNTNGTNSNTNGTNSNTYWSSWKQSMAMKNELDNIAQAEILRKEIRAFLPKELHSTLATIHDLSLLNELSYMYVMYGSDRPISPHRRVNVRRIIMPYIEAIEHDASKRAVINLLLWVMQDFGCL